MLRDKFIELWVEELNKEILDLQAFKAELTGEIEDEAARNFADPDLRAEAGSVGDGLPALMRQTGKDRGMKQKIIEYLQDAAAIVSVILFLSALYVIMAAFG
ncbi:MAG: hypothetical protein OSJ72_17380 [Lachnospiraceae bacterium]|nr:hypothetical protein [Lachnospiraceae bacterium]